MAFGQVRPIRRHLLKSVRTGQQQGRIPKNNNGKKKRRRRSNKNNKSKKMNNKKRNREKACGQGESQVQILHI